MQEFIKSTKTFRYNTIGNPNTAKTIIYVLHGYGQLSEYFIQKFDELKEEYFIVAPEGMHRFYLRGSSGRVGASWMTKEDRMNDISDNLNWLNQLESEISANHHFDKKIILGFSQGGATALRWYYHSHFKIDQLIVWAGVFPPDLNIGNELSKSTNHNKYFAIGNEDEFYTDTTEIIEYYNKAGFKTTTYEGKHDIHPQTLKIILDSYSNQ